MSRPWRDRIPVPAGINTLCGPARVSTQVSLFGRPPKPLTQECANNNLAPGLRGLIVTESVGPFRLTGHREFLAILRRVFARYRDLHPQAYADLHTAGCLCVRLVRGSTSTPSNHSWGTAVDLGFGGVVDRRGDGLTFRGLLDLYAIAKSELLFWGAGFSTEDAMHFEASEELLRRWNDAVPAPPPAPAATPIDVRARIPRHNAYAGAGLLIDGASWVQIRPMADAHGWQIEIRPGSERIVLDTGPDAYALPFRIVSGTGYVPARALADALRLPVNWSLSTRTVTIGG
jgi:hypothetical protein